MDEPRTILPTAEAQWRAVLMGDDPGLARRRWFRSHLPSSPRCKMCLSPFGGVGGAVMQRIGHRPWAKNPKYCSTCFQGLQRRHGGAEIECSLLFADVRGSTAMAEAMRPAEFRRLMGRFYDAAAEVLYDHQAIVDKFVGDEIIGIFVPAFAGTDHAATAVDAAREVLRVTGHHSAGGPWVPIGIGVNSGVAYVGAVGEGMDTELTAMGDVVNVTARLASEAGPGEILVGEGASAGIKDVAGLEHRTLELRGKTAPTDVVVLRE